MRLNLGCGSQAKPDFVNVDAHLQEGVDVVHDLDVFPWPFENDSAEYIEAFDVYEHVVNWRGFMQECYRILKLGARLFIHTAYYKNPNSFCDPDHKRFLTEESFDYWIPGTYLSNRYGTAYAGHAKFQKISVHLDSPIGDLNVILQKI